MCSLTAGISLSVNGMTGFIRFRLLKSLICKERVSNVVDAQHEWHTAYHQLELQLDRASFDTWLRQAVFLKEENGVFVIGVTSGYARDMLQQRLYRLVSRVLSDVRGTRTELRFEINRPDDEPARADSDNEMPLFKLLAQQQAVSTLLSDETSDTAAPIGETEEDKPLHTYIGSPHQTDLPDYELNARYTFDRFIVNGSNAVAYEAARAIVEYPSTQYNPFFVYGGVGLGKTHLLQAIAHGCKLRGLRTVYVPSEVFTNDLIHAIRARTTAMFRNKYRSVDVLLIDDIQFIGGKESTQEEFFHTFNTLINFNKQIVIASDRHPRELATLEDRLRSRFQGGLIADVQEPEFETRVAILRMWAKEQCLELSSDVIDILANRAPRNIRELEGVFTQIVAQSRLRGQPVSLSRAESTLERFTQPRERVTVERIIEVTARMQNVSADAIRGKGRAARINRARQIAMYLTREITEMSSTEVGTAFGRSHTTVLYGAKKIEEEMAEDRALDARVQRIRHVIINGGAE